MQDCVHSLWSWPWHSTSWPLKRIADRSLVTVHFVSELFEAWWPWPLTFCFRMFVIPFMALCVFHTFITFEVHITFHSEVKTRFSLSNMQICDLDLWSFDLNPSLRDIRDLVTYWEAFTLTLGALNFSFLSKESTGRRADRQTEGCSSVCGLFCGKDKNNRQNRQSNQNQPWIKRCDIQRTLAGI